jgi:hypothetical protein
MIADKIIDEAYREIAQEHLVNDVPHMNQVLKNLNEEKMHLRGSQESAYQIATEIDYLRAHSEILAYRQLQSNRKLGSVIIFIKKVLRKCLKFYVEPIALDQSDYNFHVTYALELMSQAIIQKDEQISSLRKALMEENYYFKQ